jgi:hypothetical protein
MRNAMNFSDVLSIPHSNSTRTALLACSESEAVPIETVSIGKRMFLARQSREQVVDVERASDHNPRRRSRRRSGRRASAECRAEHASQRHLRISRNISGRAS